MKLAHTAFLCIINTPLQQDYETGTYFVGKDSLCQVSVKRRSTNKSFPALSSIKSQVSLISYSSSGSHVAGLTSSGDMFVWCRLTDVLETHVTPFSKLASKATKSLSFDGEGVIRTQLEYFLGILLVTYSITSRE